MRNFLLVIMGTVVLLAAGAGVALLVHAPLRTQAALAFVPAGPTTVITLEIDIATLEEDELRNTVDRMTAALRDANPSVRYSGRGVRDGAARVQLADPADLEAARRAVSPLAISPDNQQVLAIQTHASGMIEARLLPAGSRALARRAAEQSVPVLERRVNPSGATPVSIKVDPESRIVIRISDATDAAYVRRIVTLPARLTFHLVRDDIDLELRNMPSGTMLAEAYPEYGYGPEIVDRRPLLTGANIVRANASRSDYGPGFSIAFTFDAEGREIFCTITRDHTNERFAILLDGKVLTAPNINEPICGGQAQIAGDFTPQSANDLARLLGAGSLPAPLILVRETVEP